MHAKYEVFFSHGSKVMAKVKVFCHRFTESHTGQKLDAPKFHSKVMEKQLKTENGPLQEILS